MRANEGKTLAKARHGEINESSHFLWNEPALRIDNVHRWRIDFNEDFVETVLATAIESGDLPDPVKIPPTIQVLAHRQAGS